MHYNIFIVLFWQSGKLTIYASMPFRLVDSGALELDRTNTNPSLWSFVHSSLDLEFPDVKIKFFNKPNSPDKRCMIPFPNVMYIKPS